MSSTNAKGKVQWRRNRGDTAARRRETMPWLIKRYKLVILGAATVGKSSLVSHFTHGSYLSVKENTLVAAFSSIYLNKCLKFDTWEVAGEERWHRLAHLYYRGAQAALVVYDVQDRASYVCAKDWIDELAPDLVIAIAANKVDLWDDLCVNSDEMKSLAQNNDYIFMETSARTGQNVHEIFAAIAEKLQARKNPDTLKVSSDEFCGCRIL
ncbi:ras-related protein Rab-5A isoform X2 [Drosophila virilis]|uniref:ras-related protein Rab-5A isoform X2 n=1 Tax=Drosophila virilis TaxID=7244 RepID=UPI0038B28CC6